MEAIPNQVALSVSLFAYQRTGQHLIAVEVAPVFLIEGYESSQAQCEFTFEWSREEDEDGEMVIDLTLQRVEVFKDCPVSLPRCNPEDLAYNYAMQVINSRDMNTEVVIL